MMNSNIRALREVLRLLAVSPDKVAAAIVDPMPSLGNQDRWTVGPYPEWMRDQKAQDLNNIQMLVWECVQQEAQKADRLESTRPELREDLDFRRYIQTVRRSESLAFGSLTLGNGPSALQTFGRLNDGESYRVGSWPNGSAT
jgi:hypothetical protein